METTDVVTTEVPKPLGIERSGYGEGFTKEEALQDWLTKDPAFLAPDGTRFGAAALEADKVEFTEMRAPKVPQRCKTEIVKQEGSRKWETRHVVVDAAGAEVGSGITKAAAVKEARKIALERMETLEVKVDKRLIAGHAVEARVSPKTSRPGRWKFRASFKF